MIDLIIDEVSEGWSLVRIDEVCDVNPRLNKSEIPDDLLVSFVPMPAVGAGNGSIDVSLERPASEVKKGFTGFKQGDVLFAKITPCMENGKMAIVPKVANGYGFGSTEFHVLRPKPEIDARYVYYFVSSQNFRGVAERYMTGAVGQKRVSTTYLKEQKIPLAPLEQQKRIVAEIEKQFSRLDEAVDNLKRVKANLKRYKAAVLKAAVEGKLTKEWRKQNPDVEPADKLLERILDERREKWQGRGKYKEPVAPDTTDLPELPEGWVWASVEQLGAPREQAVLTGPFGSNIGKADFIESGVPVLTIGCLKEKGLSLEKAKYVSESKAAELERYKLKFGDMLFSRMAAVGRAGFVTKSFDGALINYHIMRLRLSEEVALPMYFVYYVRGAKTVIDYVREVNHGATRDGINTSQLQSLPVALPSLVEQHQIVAEVESRFSIVSGIVDQLDANLRRSDILRQSILKQAFSGKLLQSGDIA